MPIPAASGDFAAFFPMLFDSIRPVSGTNGDVDPGDQLNQYVRASARAIRSDTARVPTPGAPFLGKLLDGMPMIVVDHGRPLRDRMHKARIDEQDILEAARRLQGIERLDQIKYAVLEVSGGITVIPNDRL